MISDTFFKLVMPGLVPGIHVFVPNRQERRGWPVKPGHDENDSFSKRLESPANSTCPFGQALR
jgi:hypothetical protein